MQILEFRMARKPPPMPPSIEDQAEAHFARVAAEGRPDGPADIDPADEVPEPDRQHAVPLSEMFLARYAATYDHAAATAMIKRLFPFSTTTTIERTTGASNRMSARWARGESRLPPLLFEKLTDQDAKRKAFLTEWMTLLRSHSESGLNVEIMRQAMVKEFDTEFFQNTQTL